MRKDGMMNYYSEKLFAERLRRCYDVAPPRVRQYLKAEIDYVLQKIHPGFTILELGCGYGRVLPALAGKSKFVVGIDTSVSSLMLAASLLTGVSNCAVTGMNAIELGFRDQAFDLVVCIQNGISAFQVDQGCLIRESIRVTRKGGTALFSSYADKFWDHRLVWFQRQAAAGLIGEIDDSLTGNGRIVCKDGFTASTVSPDRFLSLVSGTEADANIEEVDESSLFCEIIPR